MAKTTLKDLRDLRLEIARRGLNDVLSLPIPLLVEEASLPPKAEVLLLGMHTIEYAETLEELTSAKAQALLRKELGAVGLRALARGIELSLSRLVRLARARRKRDVASHKSASREVTRLQLGVSEAALRAWAAEHGAVDLVGCAFHEVPGADEHDLYWEKPAVTLVELVTQRPAGSRGRTARLTMRAQQHCLMQLQRRAKDHLLANEQLERRRGNLAPPTDPHLRAFYDTIEALMAGSPGIASTPLQRGEAAFRVGLAPAGDGLHISLSRPPQLGCEANPTCTLTGSGEQARLSCDCDLPSAMCRNRLDALVRMRDVVDTATYPDLDGLRDELSASLRMPVGERQARALLQQLGLPSHEPPMLNGVAAEPVWRLSEKSGVWTLSPGLRRRKKTGRGWVVRAWPQRLADDWFATRASPRDAEMYDLVKALEGLARSRWTASRRHMAVLEKRLLSLMVGHTRVVPAKGGPERVEVVRRTPVLHLARDDTKASVRVLIDGVPMAEHLTDEQLDVLSEGPLLNWRRGRAEAEVIEATPEVFRALRLERWQANKVAIDGLGMLRDELLPMARRGGATLSEAVQGEAVNAQTEPVVELAFADDALRVGLRVAPLSGGPLATPGAGPEVWYALAEGEPVHTRRDLVAERQAAEALWGALGEAAGPDAAGDFALSAPTSEEEERSWATTLHDMDAALDLVAWLRQTAEGDTEAETAEPSTTAESSATAKSSTDAARWRGLDVRWDTEQLKLGGQATARNLKVELAEGRDWFGLKAELQVDGAVIPLAQLLAAARDARRYVQVAGGRWVKVEEGLRRRLGAVADASATGRLSPLAGPGLLALEEEGAEVVGPARWLEMADRIRAAARSTPEVPGELKATLRGYQVDGFRWLARLATWAPGAVLADDMGLGKTVQALALLLHRRQLGPSLVVAPTSLGFNWQREAARFAPDLQLRALRGKADLSALDHLEPGVVVVTSWDVAALQKNRLGGVDWATLVLDEAQAIKNAATRRAKAIHALSAEFRLALTGTPLENHTGELWSVLRAAVPGLLGGQKDFRERFAVPIDRHGDPRAKAALAALIAPFVLRRLKREVAAELPPRTDVQVDVTLSPEERRRYVALQRSVAAELARPVDPEAGGQARRFRVLAALTRLRQLACHAGLVDPSFSAHSSKIIELRRRLESLREEGHQALVFSQFTSLLDRVGPALREAGLRVLQLDGRTPARQRRQLVDAFQRGEGDVFLLSIKAGGTGLNLTAASFVFHLDPWWNPAVEDQATDRAHRIGQRQAVTVYRLIARGTVEEAIYAMHGEKRALMDALMAGAGSAKALSVAELEALIMSGGQSGAETLQGELEQSEAASEAASPTVTQAFAAPVDVAEQPAPEAATAAEPKPKPRTPRSPRSPREPRATRLPRPSPPRPRVPRSKAAKRRSAASSRGQTKTDRRRAAPVDLGAEAQQALASLTRCLEAAVASGEIAHAATVRGYVVKAKRFLAWLEHHEVPLTSEAVRAAADRYQGALSSGEWPAPKSDRVFVSGTSRWLARSLARGR